MLIIDGEEQRTCPRRPILDNPAHFRELFWLYRQFKIGYLVEQGGLEDQPGKLMQCIREIDAAVDEVQRFKREQEERKQARRARQGKQRRRR